MPRRAKGPRLALRKESIRGDDGIVRSELFWVIRDGQHYRRTGCSEGDRRGAEARLASYLSEKFTPRAREGHLASLPIAEVLTAYAREHVPSTKGRTPETIGYCIAALLPFWGARNLSDIRKRTCREYIDERGKAVGLAKIRRELGVLSAAINYWNEEHGPLDAIPVVSLPEAPAGRMRWLTRQEAAMLLAGALGFYREFSCDVATRRQHMRWRRYQPGINRHLARFILLGVGTGTRKGAILDTQWLPSLTGGWVDLERGVYHRRAQEQVETNKRKPPVRLGRKIQAHLRRWRRMDAAERAALVRKAATPEDRAAAASRYLHVVAWMGRGVASVRTAWDAAVDLAWLRPEFTGDGEVTPHVLRHTRATWLMHASVDPWEAAGSLGMSMKTLDRYAHQHPDWQKNAAEV